MMILLTIFLATWFYTNFEYIQENLEEMVSELRDRLKSRFSLRILMLLYEVLSCWYCLAFWTTLAFTFNLVDALIVSFAAWFIYKITTK